MADENTDNGTVNADKSQDSSQADVKQDNQAQKTESQSQADNRPENDVKKQDPLEGVETVTWGGNYKMPKSVYEDIVRNKHGEFMDKAKKEGLLMDDDTKEAVKNYQELMDTIGSVVAPGQQITKKDVETILETERKKASENAANKAAKIEKELELTRKEIQEKESKFVTRTKKQAIYKEALDNGADPVAVQDFVDLLMVRNNLKVSNEDYESLMVVDEEGKTIFDENGKPIGVSDYVKSELEKSPHYKKAAKQSGSGANIGKEKTEPDNSLLGRMKATSPVNAIGIVRDGARKTGVNRKG